MAKYKTGFSAKERNNSEYCGFKNWDTWSVSLILRNDFRAYKFVFNNKQRLLRMSKLDKLYAIRRNSNIPFSGISFKNVDATELNQVISML